MSQVATARLDELDLDHGPPVRLLVVERDAALRRAMADTLEAAGYAALEAQDGRAALRLMSQLPAQHAPHLVIAELTRSPQERAALIKLQRHRRAPTLILVALDDSRATCHEAMLLNADTLLCKPLDLDQLVLAVRVRLRDPRTPA